ncbi:MAG: cyclic nucleotide-binding domain-containing protein [Anaerolineales bacterium]|nr:cyclic nucleotide-binding domain-containing protein [Anaerolineales bacterium]
MAFDSNVEIRLKSTTINKIGANEVFGEMALLDDSPRSASAYAKTDCKLVLVDQEKFKSLIQQDQDFAIQVMRVMAGRLRKVTKLSVMEKIRILNPTILEKLYLDE